MVGRHLSFLRRSADISQADLAELLGLSLRTITKWEAEDDDPISPSYALTCRVIFESRLLVPLLQKIVDDIFTKIPSEQVCIWLVKHSLFPTQDPETKQRHKEWEVVLHENTARYECLWQDNEICPWEGERCEKMRHRCFRNDRVHKEMQQTSLTTAPLRLAKSIILAGQKIADSEYKRLRGRTNHFFHAHTVHSLLHVPLITLSNDKAHPFGLPTALLSLENKLKRGKGGCWELITFEDGETGDAYTSKDEQTARDLLEQKYEDHLKPYVEAFDYLPS